MLRWVASWSLYWAGEIFSFLMFRGLRVYPAYNWCMFTSSDVQGPGSRGPWRKYYKDSD